MAVFYTGDDEILVPFREFVKRRILKFMKSQEFSQSVHL